MTTQNPSAENIRQRAWAVLAGLESIIDRLDEFYCDLHAYPELSLQETRTAAKIAARLRETGMEVTTDVGGNGVVGLLRNGSGPTVMIRGDMDALPIKEETGATYASTATGTGPDGTMLPVMHACGHDVHSACLVGAARLLAGCREAWKGTLMAVAQPAEEIFQGAGPMLRDGLFTRFAKPDVALGQHTWPLPTRTIGHHAGPFMSAATSLDVTIFGRGGHGAHPEVTVDPVVIAASTVMRLQTVVAREIRPGEAAVLTVGKLQAGTRSNIIPDQASLGINIRSYSDEVQEQLMEALRRIVIAECAAGRCPREPEIAIVNRAPSLVNDEATVERVRAAHVAWFGTELVIEAEKLMGTEDFSMYGRKDYYDGPAVPVAFWLLGVLDPATWDKAPGATVEEKLRSLPGVHSPRYLPERPAALRAGVEAMVVAALACLD